MEPVLEIRPGPPSRALAAVSSCFQVGSKKPQSRLGCSVPLPFRCPLVFAAALHVFLSLDKHFSKCLLLFSRRGAPDSLRPQGL